MDAEEVRADAPSGYFDPIKQILEAEALGAPVNQAELARKAGVSRQALGRRLARAKRRIAKEQAGDSQ